MMDNNKRFLARELPQNEMKLLYSLLGKGPVINTKLKQKSRFWSWRNVLK